MEEFLLAIKRAAQIQKLSDQQLGLMLYHALGDRYRVISLEGLLLREAIERLGYDSGPPKGWSPQEDVPLGGAPSSADQALDPPE